MLRTILTAAIFAGFLAATAPAGESGESDAELMAMRADGSGGNARWFNAVRVDPGFTGAPGRAEAAVPAQTRRTFSEFAVSAAPSDRDAPYLSWRNSRSSETAVDGHRIAIPGNDSDGFKSVASYERKCLPGGGGMFGFLFVQ